MINNYGTAVELNSFNHYLSKWFISLPLPQLTTVKFTMQIMGCYLLPSFCKLQSFLFYVVAFNKIKVFSIAACIFDYNCYMHVCELIHVRILPFMCMYTNMHAYTVAHM